MFLPVRTTALVGLGTAHEVQENSEDVCLTQDPLVVRQPHTTFIGFITFTFPFLGSDEGIIHYLVYNVLQKRLLNHSTYWISSISVLGDSVGNEVSHLTLKQREDRKGRWTNSHLTLT